MLGDVVPAPSDPNRVYAFTGLATPLLVSDDGGRSWTSKPTGLRRGISEIVVDPLDRNTIYAIGAEVETALYKSSDAGTTFTRLGDYQHVAVAPSEPNVLYAFWHTLTQGVEAGGISKSIDGGATWFDTARVHSNHGKVAVDPNDSRIVYANGFDLPYSVQLAGGLYRTLDGGVTWPSMFPGYTAIGFVSVDSASRVYTIAGVMFEHLLLRSANHGELWSRLSPEHDVPAEPTLEGFGLNLTSFACDPRRKETLYVSTTEKGVLVSYDDGERWQVVEGLEDPFVNRVSVSADGVVFAATRSGIYRYVPPPPRRRAVRSR
jgi:photosystem II stability/assembly factor-like uncharacterized protein